MVPLDTFRVLWVHFRYLWVIIWTPWNDTGLIWKFKGHVVISM